MSTPRLVAFAADVIEAIRTEARRAYPHEGCGALFGPSPERITRTRPIPNTEGEAPRVKFAVSARDYMAVEDYAEEHGLRLLGFWHSHPDHPARPSETDRRYAWEGLLTVVIAVKQGEPEAITAWDLDSEARFREARMETMAAAGSAGAEAATQEVP